MENPSDPIWFRILALLLPGAIAGLAAIVGVLVSHRISRERDVTERAERTAADERRLLEPLFAFMFSKYSSIATSLQILEQTLLATTESTPAVQQAYRGFASAIREGAIWMPEHLAGELFRVADEADRFVRDSQAEARDSVLASTANAQIALRRQLGIDRFLGMWTSIVTNRGV